MKMLTAMVLLAAVLCGFGSCAGAERPADPARPLPVRVLVLPKFEVGEMAGDDPGEAQDYYEHYLAGADEYEVRNAAGMKLYYRDGIALCVLGMGKINASLNTLAVLSDSRFDFSQAYILSTGCAGSAADTTVMGDVFLITAAVDYDMGHHADIRDLADPARATWFYEPQFSEAAVCVLNPELMKKVYELVKDTPLSTTEQTRDFMRRAFGGADWAVRDPRVLRGTAVTGDNYWKGIHGHRNAVLMAETYGCPDPYVATEMEDLAVAKAAERMGMLDRLIILRASVNMDVFMADDTPESLWGNGKRTSLASADSAEALDIFGPAMKNVFNTGRIIIDRILDGGL